MSVLAWFECQAGASGDMLLGALVDAGAPLDAVRRAIDALDTEPIRVDVEPVTRQGVAATKVHVRTDEQRAPAERTWADIRDILDGAELPGRVRELSLSVFERLAHAEASAHRTEPEHVHFHEVGALDALADVVGTCAAVESLGITEMACSAVALGSGFARSEHGVIPVPGPAVLELFRGTGAPVHTGKADRELCTPTGAALLTTLATRWGGLPESRIISSGAGAGTRDLAEMPNVTRVVIGEPVDTVPANQEPETLTLVEANVDDLDPRLWPAVLTRLLDEGALDAWLAPILMKKGRPAHTLSILVDRDHLPAVRAAAFEETTTIGLREMGVSRTALERAWNTVTVDGCEIGVKIAYLHGEPVNVQPEYDDVAAAAARIGRPVKCVLAAVIAAASPESPKGAD